MLAFDSSFNLLDHKYETTTDYTRPHLVLKGGYLYMTYDRPAIGAYLHKYLVQNTTGIYQQSGSINTIQVFPNPFSTQTTLQIDSPLHNATLTVENCFGQTVVQVKSISGRGEPLTPLPVLVL